MNNIGLIEGLIVIVFPALIIMITCYFALKYWGKTEEEKSHKL